MNERYILFSFRVLHKRDKIHGQLSLKSFVLPFHIFLSCVTAVNTSSLASTMHSVDGNLTDLESRAFLTAEMPKLLSILGNIATTSQETNKDSKLKSFPPAARTGLIKIRLAHPKMLFTWPLVINVICSTWVLRPRNLKYVFAITSRPCSQTKKRVSLQSISIVPST